MLALKTGLVQKKAFNSQFASNVVFAMANPFLAEDWA